MLHATIRKANGGCYSEAIKATSNDYEATGCTGWLAAFVLLEKTISSSFRIYRRNRTNQPLRLEELIYELLHHKKLQRCQQILPIIPMRNGRGDRVSGFPRLSLTIETNWPSK